MLNSVFRDVIAVFAILVHAMLISRFSRIGAVHTLFKSFSEFLSFVGIFFLFWGDLKYFKIGDFDKLINYSRRFAVFAILFYWGYWFRR